MVFLVDLFRQEPLLVRAELIHPFKDPKLRYRGKMCYRGTFSRTNSAPITQEPVYSGDSYIGLKFVLVIYAIVRVVSSGRCSV